MNFVTKLGAASAVALFACALDASAATVTINSLSGVWSSAAPSGVVGMEGIGTNQIKWGSPASSGGKSGYEFTAISTPSTVATSPFGIGAFTHHNLPIYASSVGSITSAVLDVTLSGNVDGTAFNLTSQFLFSHDETPNSASSCPGDAVACDDIVTVSSVLPGGDTVNVAGIDYIFNIAGFVDGDGNSVSMFKTTERMSNTAMLVGEFSTNIPNVSNVPLPAAGWLLLSGIGGLAAMRRKKKAA